MWICGCGPKKKLLAHSGFNNSKSSKLKKGDWNVSYEYIKFLRAVQIKQTEHVNASLSIIVHMLKIKPEF